jgi:hypothetical protein
MGIMSIDIINTESYKKQPLPEIGKEYHIFDDGKIRKSRHHICKIVDIIPFNARNYVYNIPAEFGSFEQPIIVINDQDLVEDEPLIKIIPENDYILADSFIVVSEGSFKCIDGQLPITVEVVNEDGSITISDSYSLNIVNKKIDTNNPVELTGEPLKCKKDYKEKNISLKVFNPLDKSVYDKTANILII